MESPAQRNVPKQADFNGSGLEFSLNILLIWTRLISAFDTRERQEAYAPILSFFFFLFLHNTWCPIVPAPNLHLIPDSEFSFQSL